MIEGEYGFSVHNKNERISIQGMVQPSIYNSGQTVAYVDGIAIQPGENPHGVGAVNMVMKGEIEIRFDNESGKFNELRLFYVKPTNCSIL